MKESRFNAIQKGMTAVAQKVYSAVPIAQAWTTQEILSELMRSGISITREYRVIEGCLASLVQTGVVLEGPRGKFRRTPIEIKTEAAEPPSPSRTFLLNPKPEPIPMTSPVPVVVKPPMSPIDRLAGLSTRVGEMIVSLKALQADLETAALEIEEQNAVDAAARQKLAQLQSLLKGL